MDDFSVSVPGGIDVLGRARVSPYSLVNFSKISVILCKLLSVLGCQGKIFVPG